MAKACKLCSLQPSEITEYSQWKQCGITYVNGVFDDESHMLQFNSLVKNFNFTIKFMQYFKTASRFHKDIVEKVKEQQL